MDGDSETYKYNKGIKSFFRFVFLPYGIRCIDEIHNGLYKFLLDYNRNFLLYISFIIYSILLF